MNTIELVKHSKIIRSQAQEILESSKLLDILNKHGNAHVIGSYPLDIMYGPDIDIVVESGDIRKNSVGALKEIIEKRMFRKVEYGDFVKFPEENRPKGYILVLKTVTEEVKWEIEVWFLEDVSETIHYQNLLKSRITEQNRITILEAKHLRAISNTTKYKLSSHKIYEQELGI